MGCLCTVRKGGLEPPHLSAYAPETYASTNSAISAHRFSKKKRKGKSTFDFCATYFVWFQKKDTKMNANRCLAEA